MKKDAGKAKHESVNYTLATLHISLWFGQTGSLSAT